MDDENVLKPMVAKLCELRAKKGMTEEQARKQLADASYFGTMLVVLGYADGLVSGSVNSTANTVRPALQVIKTKPGQKLVSGAFSCASRTMWPCSPTAPSTSTRMPSSFPKSRCSPPRPHVPSASTRRSVCSPTPPSAPARDRTWTWSRKPPSCSRRRLRICRWSVPSSSTPPGPPTVAATKAKGNDVAGHVNVFVFPDLCAGNIGYKAVQRSSGALAIGLVLQGLNKPVNDLSCGALVQDIINTIALTAIEAQ